MKKNLFYYLFAALCMVVGFTSCGDDDEMNPLVGTYQLADYAAEDATTNYPVAGPLFVEYNSGDQASADALAGLFRMMGGAILPQVLNSVELQEDGNIVASYAANPTIQGTDKLMTWGFGALAGSFPAETEITSLAATTGFTTSPTGLATWSEEGGKVVVKLNIANILGSALGGEELEGLEDIINGVLQGEPAEIKALIKQSANIDLSSVSDETIKKVQGWALNGIPMNKKEANGRMYLYLDKSDFDSLMKPHEDGQSSDLSNIWVALSSANIIPVEAQAAVFMIAGITTGWDATNTFNIGLELVKE